MELIEKYLKSLYKGNKNKYIEDLRDEVSEHLLESTQNLMSQGYDVEEAQMKAIEEFDDGSCSLRNLYLELSNDIELLNVKNNNLIKRTNILCNIFKYISIISITILLILTFLNKHNLITYTQYFEWDSIKTEFNEKIKSIASVNNVNDVKSYRNELDSILKSDEFSFIKGVRIYNNEKSAYSDSKSDVLYRYGPHRLNIDDYSYSGNVKSFDGEDWFYRVNIGENYLSKIIKIIKNIVICVAPISIIIYLYFKFTLQNINKL